MGRPLQAAILSGSHQRMWSEGMAAGGTALFVHWLMPGLQAKCGLRPRWCVFSGASALFSRYGRTLAFVRQFKFLSGLQNDASLCLEGFGGVSVENGRVLWVVHRH